MIVNVFFFFLSLSLATPKLPHSVYHFFLSLFLLTQLNLFIFPEGTRSNAKSPMLLPFKKGAFHLALQAQLPIIPIICETYSPLYHSSQLRFEPGKLILKVLEPVITKGVVAYEGKEGVDRLSDEVRKRMLEGLIELSQRPGSVSSRTIQAPQLSTPTPLS